MTRSSRRNTASCSWGSSKGPTIVQVLTNLPHDNVSKQAALCLISHGQVKIGSYTFGLHEQDRPLDRHKCYGRMLTYGSRQTRLIGGGIPVTDQLELAGAAA